MQGVGGSLGTVKALSVRQQAASYHLLLLLLLLPVVAVLQVLSNLVKSPLQQSLLVRL
jgi:hypothetical protein